MQVRASVGLAAAGLLVGCGVKQEYLVPTPLVYSLGYAPEAHPDRYEPTIDVLFCTSREATPGADLPFGNDPSPTLTLGRAVVRVGPEDWAHADFEAATLGGELDDPPAIELVSTETIGPAAQREASGWRLVEHPEAVSRLRAEMHRTTARHLLVFVDGTKGDFYRATALAGELRHLVGRDMPVVTFSWPSHQNIFSYIWGEDMERADDAGLTFAAMLDWLAEHSGAEQIHVVSYSAGGRVAAIGTAHLRTRRSDVDAYAANERFRLGTLVFAAADEPAVRFLDEVHAIHEVADRIVVTISSDDHALVLSDVFSGQGERIGHMRESGLSATELAVLREHPRVGFVDVSHGHARGFEIKGHHYWYRNPWVLSDVIMALRTGAPGDQRGLDPETVPHLWAITERYPDRLHRAAEGVLPRQEAQP